jgi:hypothetical protein
MKKLKIILFLLGVVFLACSCKSNREEFKENGILQEHQLKRLKTFNSDLGQINGGIFFGVNGTSKSEQMLQFWWEVRPGELIATAIPIRKFKFLIDESKKNPTIEFLFSDGFLNRAADATFKNLNINDILDNEVNFCLVRLSKETLEKEIYLPE